MTFNNPLADPNLSYNGKTLAQRAKELTKEEERRKLEEKLRGKRNVTEPEPEHPSVEAINTPDYLTLTNISCVDAEDNVFEHYDELHVAKDIIRNPDNNYRRFTPYQAAVHFEKQGNGLFLPNFALSCNIVAALYQNKTDPEIEKVLQQYKNYSQDYGWHAQNTVINWGSKQIIHYPSDSDFPRRGGSENINQDLRKELDFDPEDFADMSLESALKKPNFRDFIRNLTGLKNPEVLIEIGDYFGKTVRVWVSSSNETRAAGLGCIGRDFNLYANDDLFNWYAARGVRARKKFVSRSSTGGNIF